MNGKESEKEGRKETETSEAEEGKEVQDQEHRAEENMSLKDFREAYYTASDTASACARNLAFAGIAIVWVFRAGEGVASAIPSPLIWPLILFATTLAFDLVQYLWRTLAWGVFCRFKEKNGVKEEADIDAPSWLNWPSVLLFWSKAAAVIGGYVFLVSFLWKLSAGKLAS